jgi:hypothetical protein
MPGKQLACALALLCTSTAFAAQGEVEYLNPEGLHKNPAFSPVAVASGDVKTLYVGGQVVAKGDLKQQTAKAIANVETALNAAGAKLEHVVKWNVHIVQGQPLLECGGRGAVRTVCGRSHGH